MTRRLNAELPEATRKASSPALAAPSAVHEVLRSRGQELDAPTRSIMEPRFRHDFSRVRVHADSAAAASARSVNAAAYTVENHVVFGNGQYSPGTDQGRRLLCHELTHAIQQEGVDRAPDALRLGPAGGALEAQARAAETAPSQVTPAAAGLAAGLVQRDVLPVATFSPAPGLKVDRTGKSVSITGAMELSGPAANAARAASIQRCINTTWTHTFPDGYSVNCSITVTYRPTGSKAANATQIEAKETLGPSEESRGLLELGDRSMTLNASETDAFTWTPAHEFGHIIGLKDRYTESIMSRIKGQFGGERKTPPDPNYEGNLMGAGGGVLESKNVKDIAEENEPSSYWINDDDQVRAWVTGHPPSDIRRLSITDKLKAIRTLMGGWISDDDVAAIGRICSSVATKPEADAIRRGINLSDMTSLGQRAMLRVALAKMP